MMGEKKKKDIGRKREDKKIKTAEQEGKLSKTRPNEKDEWKIHQGHRMF